MIEVPERWRKGGSRSRGSVDPTMAGEQVGGTMLTPAQIAAGGSEHAHQAALFQWVNTVWCHPMGHMLFAVPNGGDRAAHVGASMRAEGVKSGVPDLCWPIVAGAVLSNGVQVVEAPGLYLELKVPGRERTKGGGLSPAQVRWLGELRSQGYATAVAYGWEAAAWVLAMYAAGHITARGEALNLPPVDDEQGQRLLVSVCGTPLPLEPKESWLRSAGQWHGGG